MVKLGRLMASETNLVTCAAGLKILLKADPHAGVFLGYIQSEIHRNSFHAKTKIGKHWPSQQRQLPKHG
jgi:hypothetical protein